MSFVFYFKLFISISIPNQLSIVIFSSQEKGTLDRIVNKWIVVKEGCPSDDLQLGYEELFGVFMLLTTGVLVSFGVFSAEGAVT